jgi:ligand-binding SRPBCC domain-containing protein
VDEYIVNQFLSRKSSQPLNYYCQELSVLTLVSKSIDIKTPIDNVFTYFARPEHVSDQIKNDTVGMTVVPLDIKEGMGVGTTFRIIGDFSGKRLEWDCETTEFVKNEKIVAKQIKGPFKKWEITNEFKSLGANLTRITMSVDYKMPFGPLGAILDKAKFAKSADKGMETALYNVRGLLEGNGSIPVYITLDAYQKLLAEKKKMNNVPVSTALTAILEKYSEMEAKSEIK